MEETTNHFSQLATPSKDFARRLMTIGENRLELLMVEVQEERERLLRAILLALGVALFAFLGGIALTIALVVLLWSLSPIGVLLTLAGLYIAAAIVLYRRFAVLQRNWKTFPATFDQLRKDRACLDQCLA
ncbi:MAG TPA: phage holin family protein [Candidatus Limnocylindria bacterium]|nr:phage holin family protein [Candidatus Limnocylindria bacterium]